MKLSSRNENNETINNIKLVTEIKILGIYFSNTTPANQLKKNWEDRINEIRRTLQSWAKRDLTIIGKILILKTFALSKLNFIIGSTGLPQDTLIEINRIFFQFLWKKKMSNRRAFEKIKRKVIQADTKDGGLNMFCIIEIQEAAMLQWAESILYKQDDDVSKLAFSSLKNVGGKVAFKGSSKSIKGIETVENDFWKRVLETWIKYKKEEMVKNVYYEPLFNNKNITYHGNTLFLKTCLQRNISIVKDLYDGEGFIEYETFLTKTGVYARSRLEYNLLKTCVIQMVNRHEPSIRDQQEQIITFNKLTLGKIKRRGFLKLIKKSEKSQSPAIWMEIFDIPFHGEYWLLPWQSTKEVRLRTLQWKILNNIFPTNILLKKMGVKESEDCSKCKTKDFIEHFFGTCTIVKPLWEEIKKLITSFIGRLFDLTLSDIILGINDKSLTKNQREIVNHALLIGKMCISKVKYGKPAHLISLFYAESRLRKLELLPKN